mgnify:CR=1 FL=1
MSIAYFLLKKGIKSTIIERTAVAAAASGKSGGFLVRVTFWFHCFTSRSHSLTTSNAIGKGLG